MNVKELVGRANIVFITLDTLRYDVAAACWDAGRIPNLARLMPPAGWEKRHSPGSFTFAAHQAFFAGFLPTPVVPNPAGGPHPRHFAAEFLGSESTTDSTFVFPQADLVSGLAAVGYRTVCIGGVGFFNQQTALGTVLPGLFQESYWQPEFGVTDPDSTRNQVAKAMEILTSLSPDEKLFLFINVSALHQPNCHYTPGASSDSAQTQAAALEYVDGELAKLWPALSNHGPTWCLVMSDHGTAYGEQGFTGHRVSLPVVMEVPYTEFVVGK